MTVEISDYFHIDKKYNCGMIVKIVSSDEPQYIGLVGRLTRCFPKFYRKGYDRAGFIEQGKGDKGLIFNITKDDVVEILQQ